MSEIVNQARKLVLADPDYKPFMKYLIDDDLDFVWELAGSSPNGFEAALSYLCENNFCSHENFRRLVIIGDRLSDRFIFYTLAEHWPLSQVDIDFYENGRRELSVYRCTKLKDPIETVSWLVKNNRCINAKYYELNSPGSYSWDSTYYIKTKFHSLHLKTDNFIIYLRNPNMCSLASLRVYRPLECLSKNMCYIHAVSLKEMAIIWKEFGKFTTLSLTKFRELVGKIDAPIEDLLSEGFTHYDMLENQFIDPVKFVNTMPPEINPNMQMHYSIRTEILRRQSGVNTTQTRLRPEIQVLCQAKAIIAEERKHKDASLVFATVVLYCDGYFTFHDP